MGFIGYFEENRKLSRAITIFLAVAIFVISSIDFGPSKRAYLDGSLLSIAYHFLAFFFFNLFLMISTIGGKRKDLFWLSILISVFYGVLDEVHQYYVPSRFFSVEDIVVDSAGVFFSGLLYLWRLILNKAF
ncbi:VanZ family protein [Candidatus Pacearchaeota archaeon]|nr:MAG: VanZ family protein [Candidatus Pacearchaeota archaeon]